MTMRVTIALLLCVLTVSAQQPVHVEPPVYVTAIEVVADVRDASGKVPAGLTPEDFVLLEAGVERKIIGVDYLRTETAAAEPGAAASAVPRNQKPWQTVIYFETDLSNGRGRRQSAKELGKHVDKLVRMGTVDVIFANPSPKPLVLNSRDPEAVRQALLTVEKSGGANQLALHRMEFRNYAQSMTQMEAIKATAPDRIVVEASGRVIRETATSKSYGSGQAMSAAMTALDPKLVRPYIEQEVQLINRFRRHLTTWLSNYSRYAPRTLIMVTDGYDLDPLEYYAAHLNKNDEMELRGYVSQAALADSAGKMASVLATAGWTTVSVQGDTLTDGWVDDPSTMTNIGRVHKNTQAAPQTGPRMLLLRAADPLMQYAEETGGEVVGNSGKIAQAIERIDDRLRITYQVDRKPDGKPLQIELKARDPKLKVRAARWAASATAAEMAETRALAQLHEGNTFPGDLAVDSKVEWKPNATRKQGTLRVSSKIPLPNVTSGDFRFTLAVLVPPKEAFVTSRPLNGYRLSNGVFQLQTPIDLPPATSVVVVSIEETTTGMWGSSRITVP